jgi:hypothetical protein
MAQTRRPAGVIAELLDFAENLIHIAGVFARMRLWSISA